MLKHLTSFRYLHADVPFLKAVVEAAGYQVAHQSGENDAQKQVSQAENVLTQGVDAIVIQPVDSTPAERTAQKSAVAGVPLASYDDLILGAEHAAFVGRDPKEGGASAAKAVLEAQPTGNYVLIGGDPGQTGSTEMQKGYHEVLDPVVAKGLHVALTTLSTFGAKATLAGSDRVVNGELRNRFLWDRAHRMSLRNGRSASICPPPRTRATSTSSRWRCSSTAAPIRGECSGSPEPRSATAALNPAAMPAPPRTTASGTCWSVRLT